MASHTSTKKKSHVRRKSKAGDSPQNKPKSPASPESGRSSSSDPVCAICLGAHENKCFTNSCLHEFCFTCLLEWSKVKAECPLCKQPFTTIIHNIRSNSDYDEHKIDILQPQEQQYAAFGLLRRFHYRTTLTQERRELLAIQRRIQAFAPINHFLEEGVLPYAGLHQPRRSRFTGTSEYRRQRYIRDLWVRPLPDITNRFRDSTPEFFHQNPAGTQRLIPWLNRELNVLLAPRHENRLSYVLEMILRLLPQHHICSRQFREAVQPYIGGNTKHFLHEFYQFARSPYDMTGFDENANYEPRNTFQFEEVAVSESSDEEYGRLPIPNRLRTSEIPLPPSPQPGPSGLGRLSRVVDDGQSYTAASSSTRLTDDEDEEEEDVEILEVVRPQTPEVITLSDSNEDEEEEARDEPARSTSRGKALKTSRTSSSAGRETRKNKKLKTPTHKKRRKRDRSSSSESSSYEPPRSTNKHERSYDKRPSARPSNVRYWDMDSSELHEQIRGNSRSSRKKEYSHKRLRSHKRKR